MANVLLVFDVGGTHIRAVHLVGNEQKELIKVAHGKSRSFLEWIKSSPMNGLKADQVVIAAAGPKEGSTLQMTNLSWFFDQQELETFFKCPVLLLEDLEAAAHLLPTMDSPTKGTRALIVPGTGLGEAYTVPNGEKWIVMPTESGQTLYTPTLELGKKRVRLKRVRLEELLSGKGLSLIHQTLTGQHLSPEEVGALGGEAVHYFLELLLEEAQAVALRVLPMGGLFLGGAIVRALSPTLQKIGFATFYRHPTMERILKKIPLAIIETKDIVLKGAILAAKEAAK